MGSGSNQRHREMLEGYGFGLPPVLPVYGSSSVGAWRIEPRRGMIGSSYIARHAIEEDHHILFKGSDVWMATSLLERESHARHFDLATGHVVVAGLGMGFYAAAAASKPEVSRVTVIEIDRDVINLVLDGPLRTLADKIDVIHGDALDAQGLQVIASRCGRVDYLYADIWQDLPNAEALAQTRAMVELVRPNAAGWWGQEMEIALYCSEIGEAISAESIRQFAVSAGVPIPSSHGYAVMCEDVAEANEIGNSLGLAI